MATVVAKTAEGKAVVPRAYARVVDKWDDGLVVRVDITPELLGQLLQLNVDHLIVSTVGPKRAGLKAVK